MKAGIVVFPGTNCGRDTYEACRFLGWNAEYIWHNKSTLKDYDVIFLPGGFSYGDYIRAGCLAKFSPVMTAIREFIYSEKGMVAGICNGFQILCESGLLEGALTYNLNNKFICDDIELYFEGEEICLPVAHKEGRYIKPKDTVINDLIFLKYKRNPNGSDDDIAGLYDKKRKILALMPHPERAVFKETGNTDGIKIFNFIQKELNL